MWRVWALPGWRSRARSWSSRVGAPLVNVLVVAGLAVSLGAARATLAVHADLPSAAASRRRRVLFRNPRSGGGEAERFSLAAEARARGIQPIELKPGTDFETLVREAVDRGADGLAMAGGDGSQAIVAERVLRKVCVPAGTRNHIALDLGVDRDDVVGAPGAFVDGGERTVDLAEVNGRVFVNTISLGLYAEAVQRAGCRDAKLRTLLDTVPDVLGLDGIKLDLDWARGHAHHSDPAVLVSKAPRVIAALEATGRFVSRGTGDKHGHAPTRRYASHLRRHQIMPSRTVERWVATLGVVTGRPAAAGPASAAAPSTRCSLRAAGCSSSPLPPAPTRPAMAPMPVRATTLPRPTTWLAVEGHTRSPSPFTESR